MSVSTRYLTILTLMFCTTFGVVWAYAYTARMAFLDTDYPAWSAKLKMIDRCNVGDVAILGDSRASADYIPTLLEKNVRNLALSGTTPIETYYEAKRIFACPNPPKMVILSFSPLHYTLIDWFWLHAASYGQLSFADLQEVATEEKRLGRSDLYGGAFGSEPPPMMKNWMYAHHFPSFDFASLVGAAVFGRLQANLRIEAETEKQLGQHVIGDPVQCVVGNPAELSQGNFLPNPMITLYLQRLLRLLNTHGVRVMLGPSPTNQRSRDSANPAMISAYDTYVLGQVTPYSNVTIAGDLLPGLPDCDFGDEHHLNQRGAAAFSKAFGRTYLR